MEFVAIADVSGPDSDHVGHEAILGENITAGKVLLSKPTFLPSGRAASLPNFR